jgi:hypothetical protein
LRPIKTLRILRAVCWLARPACGGSGVYPALAGLAFFRIFRHKIKVTDKIKKQFSVQQAAVRRCFATLSRKRDFQFFPFRLRRNTKPVFVFRALAKGDLKFMIKKSQTL